MQYNKIVTFIIMREHTKRNQISPALREAPVMIISEKAKKEL